MRRARGVACCSVSSSSSCCHRLCCGYRYAHTLPRLRARTLANVKQQPLYPGAATRATQFAGQHVYKYASHTFAIAYESMSIAVVPLGCVAALLYWLFAPLVPQVLLLSLLPVPLSSRQVCVGYAVAVATLSRLVARGRVNRVRRDLTGKHVVVTGATSGIGLHTAAQLARMGARVTLLVRDGGDGGARGATARAVAYITARAKRATTTTTTVTTTAAAESAVRVVALDLCDFVAVREYCKQARQRGEAIDVLVNAAAVLYERDVKTRFGDDAQLAVNFLGPYLLTEGLLPLIAAAHGRVVYVTCTAHTAVRYSADANTRNVSGGSNKTNNTGSSSGSGGVVGDLVSTYLSGRGVWSPRVAGQFDALEQYGFTKLGNIYHAQELAQRALAEATKAQSPALTAAATATTLAATCVVTRGKSGSTVATAPVSAPSADDEAGAAAAVVRTGCVHAYTTCACAPGAVLTNLYRHVTAGPFVMRYLYWLLLLAMRTAWEGSQGVVNCCVRDEVRSGGYYMHTRYSPTGLSRAACSVRERDRVMAWARRRMQPYMTWD